MIAAFLALPDAIESAIAFSARTGHALDAAREAGVAGAVMLVTVLILFSGRQRPARVAAAALVTLVAVAELLWWNAASRLNAESRSLYAVLEAPTGAEATAITLLETAIAADHRRGEHPRVEVLGLGGPWQNLAMVRGWEATNGYNPLRIGWYDRLVAPGEENWKASQRRFPPSFDNYDCALARALGLTLLVLGLPLDRSPGLAAPPAADLLLPGPPVWIYRLAGAMPRARIFGRSEIAKADATRPDGGGPVEPSVDRALIDGAMASRQSSPPPSSDNPSVVKIESSRPGRVVAVTTTKADGLLVVHDSYYTGWIAESDGKGAPIPRGEILFRAVEVPAGIHPVTFRFAPFSLANLHAALSGALGGPTTRP